MLRPQIIHCDITDNELVIGCLALHLSGDGRLRARPQPIVGDTMTIIALYAFQIFIGILFLAAGYAKLTGMEFMSEPFAAMGLGKSALVLAGSVEMFAGVCLLFPRAGAIGAVLVGVLMIGTVATISHRAVNQGFYAPQPVGFQFRPSGASTAQI